MKIYVDCFYYGFYMEEEELVKYSININNMNNYNSYLSKKYNSENFNKIKKATHIEVDIDNFQLLDKIINIDNVYENNENNENNENSYNFTNLRRLIYYISFLKINYF